MINLLSAEYKNQINAARLNVSLLHFCIVLIITLAFASLLFLFSTSWLAVKNADALQQYNDNEAKTTPYNDVLAQATTFKKNLNQISAAANNRSQYSTVLIKLGQALPAGVVLSHLDIGTDLFTKPLDLSATTKDTAGALAIKQQLESSGVFSSVKLGATTCDATDCQVLITATLNPSVALKKGATP